MVVCNPWRRLLYQPVEIRFGMGLSCGVAKTSSSTVATQTNYYTEYQVN